MAAQPIQNLSFVVSELNCHSAGSCGKNSENGPSEKQKTTRFTAGGSKIELPKPLFF
jgi:hypothetical protein